MTAISDIYEGLIRICEGEGICISKRHVGGVLLAGNDRSDEFALKHDCWLWVASFRVLVLQAVRVANYPIQVQEQVHCALYQWQEATTPVHTTASGGNVDLIITFACIDEDEIKSIFKAAIKAMHDEIEVVQRIVDVVVKTGSAAAAFQEREGRSLWDPDEVEG